MQKSTLLAFMSQDRALEEPCWPPVSVPDDFTTRWVLHQLLQAAQAGCYVVDQPHVPIHAPQVHGLHQAAFILTFAARAPDNMCRIHALRCNARKHCSS